MAGTGPVGNHGQQCIGHRWRRRWHAPAPIEFIDRLKYNGAGDSITEVCHRPTMRVCTLILALLLAAGGRAVMAEEVSYTLEARAMPSIARALERMKPQLQFTDVAIDHDAVTAHLCPEGAPEQHCFVLRLEYPTSDCDNHWGPFCASFPAGAPAAAFTAVVMHLNPNDYFDVDDRQYPCSNWEPLLVYEDTGTRLRYATPNERGKSKFAWLMQNSPPSYVLRAALKFSALAAHLAAVEILVGRRLGYGVSDVGDGVRESHLTAILRDARDELRARDIPVIVNSFRDRPAIESGISNENLAEEKMKRIAEGLGIVTLDTWEPLRTAQERGEHLYSTLAGPRDRHFNLHGHALMAAWLHQQLPGAIERARVGDSSPSKAPDNNS
jgi:hypothetical protein